MSRYIRYTAVHYLVFGTVLLISLSGLSWRGVSVQLAVKNGQVGSASSGSQGHCAERVVRGQQFHFWIRNAGHEVETGNGY